MLQDKIETQKGENKILRQKLQSKSEALVILSQELDKVRNECEDYRELTRRYVLTSWAKLGLLTYMLDIPIPRHKWTY